MALKEGRWQLRGDPEILVEQDSATKPVDIASEALSLFAVQMNRTHSDLPKFSQRHDTDYKNLKGHLEAFRVTAFVDVHARFALKDNEWTAAHEAVIKGHLDTPIHYVQADKPEIMSLLVGAGANVDEENSDGNTALMMAVCRGDIERVEMYSYHKADFKARQPWRFLPGWGDGDAVSPIQVAPRKQHYIFKILVKKGAGHNDSLWNSLLQYGVSKGNIEAVQTLISAGANVKWKDTRGYTAVRHALLANTCASLKITETLVGAKANLEARSNSGFTALHAVTRIGYSKSNIVYRTRTSSTSSTSRQRCKARNEDLPRGRNCPPLGVKVEHERKFTAIKILLDRGASMLAKASQIDPHGRRVEVNPPHLAAKHGFPEAIVVYLDRGFDINKADSLGKRMIQWAIRLGHTAVAELLVKRGSHMVGDTPGQGSALHWTSWKGFVDTTLFLLKNDVDVNCVDRNGYTSLHYAAQQGHLSLVKVLLQKGANVNAETRGKQTAQALVVMRNHHEVVNVLKRAEERIQKPGPSDQTPISNGGTTGNKKKGAK
ncbi:hypothetical protein N0V82_001266 [Gnomoniopsis sp. IMI 355080]|nr:hypothetical protein N0V82_001266 [Gnomoniopsis sp. IMI 355080]